MKVVFPQKVQCDMIRFDGRRRPSSLPLVCCGLMHSVFVYVRVFPLCIIWLGSGGRIWPHIYSKAGCVIVAYPTSVGIHEQSRSQSHLPPSIVCEKLSILSATLQHA